MIENTLENKAKFFGLYLNRKKCIIRQGYINRDNIEPNGVDEYDSLELKHLSSITDEDAIEVAKNMYYVSDESDEIKVTKQINIIGLKSTKVAFYQKGIIVSFIEIYERGDIHFSDGYFCSEETAQFWGRHSGHERFIKSIKVYEEER